MTLRPGERRGRERQRQQHEQRQEAAHGSVLGERRGPFVRRVAGRRSSRASDVQRFRRRQAGSVRGESNLTLPGRYLASFVTVTLWMKYLLYLSPSDSRLKL